MTPRVIGVVGGDPFDRRTWSGASHHLFTALGEVGALEAAVDARAPARYDQFAKVAAFAPNVRRWRERYEFSPVRRTAMSRHGGQRARAIDPAPDALLQVGAYFDFHGIAGLRPRLRCSFHDSNLARFSAEWESIEDARAAHIQREWRNEQRVFDGLDLIMTMSDWLRRSFIEDFGQDPDKVVTVGSGANVVAFPDPPAERDWSVPRVLFVGFDWHRKGLVEVRDAFRRLREERPDAELWIVGPERPADVADEAGVTWHGRVDRSHPEGDAQIARLHREATMFALPSVYDPMPNVLLEAMAWELPVIASQAGSMPEMVGDGVGGLLVPSRDADAVLGAMRRLADDAELSRAMGKAGRARVLERFTWRGVAERMVAAIEARLP
ncbi:MAG TPA: glycosyltransferase family 4 protein [Conexibacter sp.]|nr:glycosyltransferase family 4 protein [Conexibacter sp.]